MRWLSKGFESLLAELAAHDQQQAPAAGPATTRLASSRFDVVVVGSGYGGAVAACRFAEAGLRVAVLERGREYLPGEFPNDIAELPGHVRIDRAGHDGPGRTAGSIDGPNVVRYGRTAWPDLSSRSGASTGEGRSPAPDRRGRRCAG